MCDLTYEALPPRVVDLAKACVLGQIGVQIFGATLAHAQAPYRMVQAMGAAPESTIAFYGTRTVAPYAAYVNAVFASDCELDDGNPAAGHGRSPVIPTTLALCQSSSETLTNLPSPGRYTADMKPVELVRVSLLPEIGGQDRSNPAQPAIASPAIAQPREMRPASAAERAYLRDIVFRFMGISVRNGPPR